LVITTHQLVAAIAATVAGFAVTLPQPFFPDGGETQGIRSEPSNPAQLSLAEHLTAREVEVLRLVTLGQGNKEVAAQLNVSEHTVKFHVSSVLAKLGARSRTEAVTIGILRGLVAI
jgi:DNA-binding NarL/FixJ family response regulator